MTDPDYWDCECDSDYVHSKKKGNFCPKCRAFEKDQPDSILREIEYQYDPLQDIAIKK